ncbi:MAG: hypothetical protein KDI68_07895 [Gammaproteobacteria bacterium]|nr:hypothetical protein [Gammaproteobacteria bacterium]
MKLKTGLLLLLIVVGLAYGGAKFYLHKKTKDRLDEWVIMVSPFAELSYGEIHSDLRGSLAVDGIYLSSADGAVLQIGHVEVEGPGPLFLYDLTRGFGNKAPPESIVFKVTSLSVPVDQNLRASFPAFETEGAELAPVEPCTLAGLFRYAGLDNIGMEQMVADAVLGYNFDRSRGEARMFFDYDLKAIESMSLNLAMESLPQPGAVMLGELPSITSLELSYKMEPDYAQRMVAHCAKQADTSPGEFLSALFTRSEAYFQSNLGFVPGPGLRDMLQSLLTVGGVVQISAAPGELDPGQLFAYQPQQLIEMFGVSVAYNDNPVTDLSMQFAATADNVPAFPAWPGLETPPAEPEASDSESPEIDASTPSRRPRMRYLETPVSELHRFVGSRVRLYTAGVPQPKQGILTSYKNSVFSVVQEIYRGKMTAHVALSDLTRAEVLRSPPAQP